MSEVNEKGFWDVVTDYFRGRIETPFLIAFAASWMVINRDLIFFITFYGQSDKYLILKAWDFSKTADFFGLISFETPYLRNLVLPAFYASVFSIMIHPIELFVGAIRYFISGFARASAESGKRFYEDIGPYWTLRNRSLALEKRVALQTERVEKNEVRVKALDDSVAKLTDLNYQYQMSAVRRHMYEALILRHTIAGSNLNFRDVEKYDYDCKIEIVGQDEKVKSLFGDEFMELLTEHGFSDLAYKIASNNTAVYVGKSLSGASMPFKVNSIKQIVHSNIRGI